MAKPKKNVIGEVYGRLTITGDAPYRSKDRRVFVACSCGNTKDVLLGDLRRGDTVSCGCFLKEVITKHGDAGTRLYRIYNGMLNRCYLPKMSGYDNYGARGIGVCAAWKASYEVFRDWAISAGYADQMSIDRRDVDKDYSPDNCRWIPETLQQRNKRKLSNKTSNYLGVSQCKRTGRWLAYIKINGVGHNLGRHPDAISAATARDQYIVDNKLKFYKMNDVLNRTSN